MTTHDTRPFADTFISDIPGGTKEATESKPFCWNSACDCRTDQDAIAQVQQYVQDGLLTQGEATNFINGKTI